MIDLIVSLMVATIFLKKTVIAARTRLFAIPTNNIATHIVNLKFKNIYLIKNTNNK
ncbi:hypothetical protein F2Q69_00036824 [Brassica cretica]|uniref:Uncharacterized protein n=1 Tax=Brassica cretica TaxID=69181 RepID=A0A8S9SCY8_BRACR|nr:hypothetical protein F2Q69_00036824 [Brassica cretica]